MRIVIQCAAVKTAGAGSLADAGGTPILFVAHPALAPADVARVHARPDDLSDDGRTWRASLLAYNSDRSVNSLSGIAFGCVKAPLQSAAPGGLPRRPSEEQLMATTRE
jgi:hypothetical protein